MSSNALIIPVVCVCVYVCACGGAVCVCMCAHMCVHACGGAVCVCMCVHMCACVCMCVGRMAASPSLSRERERSCLKEIRRKVLRLDMLCPPLAFMQPAYTPMDTHTWYRLSLQGEDNTERIQPLNYSKTAFIQNNLIIQVIHVTHSVVTMAGRLLGREPFRALGVSWRKQREKTQCFPSCAQRPKTEVK